MKRHRIIPIVEGHGEQVAVPRLLSRWFKFRRFTNFDTPDLAIRAPGASALKCPHDDAEALGIEYYVGLAARQAPAGILVVLDADDECIERTRSKARKGLGPELLERARRIAPHIWRRFWCAREGRILADVDGYLMDPEAPKSNYMQSDAVSFEAFKEWPCLLLLGEPGIGKTNVMKAAHKSAHHHSYSMQ